MQLMEDLSTIPLNPKVIVQSVASPGFPPNAPPNIPITNDLPTKDREFKQRSFAGSLAKLEHLLELKQLLIKRESTDKEMKIQFAKEVQEIKNKIIELQKQIHETNQTNKSE